LSGMIFSILREVFMGSRPEQSEHFILSHNDSSALLCPVVQNTNWSYNSRVPWTCVHVSDLTRAVPYTTYVTIPSSPESCTPQTMFPMTICNSWKDAIVKSAWEGCILYIPLLEILNGNLHTKGLRSHNK
jgi:hypothetical protein